MKKFKTFEIEYLPETELKNPRCKISNNLDRQTVILPVSVDDNNILDTAKKYLEAKTKKPRAIMPKNQKKRGTKWKTLLKKSCKRLKPLKTKRTFGIYLQTLSDMPIFKKC
jgi:hypothetical protein